jgi:hypothetical protein
MSTGDALLVVAISDSDVECGEFSMGLFLVMVLPLVGSVGQMVSGPSLGLPRPGKDPGSQEWSRCLFLSKDTSLSSEALVTKIKSLAIEFYNGVRGGQSVLSLPPLVGPHRFRTGFL